MIKIIKLLERREEREGEREREDETSLSNVVLIVMIDGLYREMRISYVLNSGEKTVWIIANAFIEQFFHIKLISYNTYDRNGRAIGRARE